MLDFRRSSKQEVNSSTELAIFANSSAPWPVSFAKLRSLELALKTHWIFTGPQMFPVQEMIPRLYRKHDLEPEMVASP